MHKISNSETKVTEVISFILEQFRSEKVNQDLDVAAELILIARILHQRFGISNGKQVKEDKSIVSAKIEILKEIKDDEYYELIKNFIKDYDQYRNNSLN
jgi:HEAT repeat protein|tara:strand:+ start:251 stop:547 length:297 start_codon:yes stop_codon:yes gene_type:complete